MKTWVIFGNQLFPVPALKKLGVQHVYMAEDDELCTHFRYHKLKLVLFLTAMRRYRNELKAAGIEVHYEALEKGAAVRSYETKLKSYVRANRITELHFFEIEDKFMEARMVDFCKGVKLPAFVHRSLMFVTSREDFKKYLASQRAPFMKTFYQWQRSRLGILVDSKGKPKGGQWSFDTENRKKLPKNVVLPSLPPASADEERTAVSELIDDRFPNHPGDTSEFWFPTTRKEALAWLDRFFAERFAFFGPYEDAIAKEKSVLFHSVLTPALNLGLLVPHEVIKKALTAAEKYSVPIASLEGFIRQIIGWREFIRGIYQNYSEEEERKNFFGHTRKLSDAWYNGSTGIAPLDDVIKRVMKLGYCHHIERLMVLSNLMLMVEVDPREVHRWFMEMFVDSSDWVMGPNVYGMGQFSDGGIFATKPYLCASNYLLKMSDFKRGDWCEEVDALFWTFLSKHAEFFKRNPRLGMLLKTYEKKATADRKKMATVAENVRARLTH